MDLYPTTETWTGTPGTIAPADGNAASAAAPASLPPSDEDILNGAPRQQDAHRGSAQTGATSALDLGPNNERLEDLKPKLVHALRELVRQYREEGVTARRHEIRRIRQARLFWQGLQYAWWNPNDMNWHLPFEQRFSDDRALEEMPRYQFVTNFYQGFGLSFVAVLSQDVPSEDRDAYLYETLVKIVSAVNATSANAGVDPATPSPAPPAIAALKGQGEEAGGGSGVGLCARPAGG